MVAHCSDEPNSWPRGTSLGGAAGRQGQQSREMRRVRGGERKVAPCVLEEDG